MRQRPRRYGFTLVEVVVVIGIIICLMTILLPVISKVREAGKQALCVSNLHQLTAAWIAYAGDNERRICGANPSAASPAPATGWIGPPEQGGVPGLESGLLWRYLKDPAVYRCPDDASDAFANKSSYQINGLLNGTVGNPFPLLRLDDIQQPARTFVFIEGCSPGIILKTCFKTPLYPTAAFPNFAWPGENHHITSASAIGTGISFADGHAIFWKYSDARVGNLVESAWAGLLGPTYLVSPQDVRYRWPVGGFVAPNSPDLFQLEAWSGGPMPPNVDQ
jgi:hypothetical protein